MSIVEPEREWKGLSQPLLIEAHKQYNCTCTLYRDLLMYNGAMTEHKDVSNNPVAATSISVSLIILLYNIKERQEINPNLFLLLLLRCTQ